MAHTTTRHVFMSYSRKDEDIMRRIAVFLRKQGINVWVDNEMLVPGTPIWAATIEKAIISSGAIIVILSPNSKESEWVRREISYARSNKIDIFPILIAGEVKTAIPIDLINYHWVDIRQNERMGMSSLSRTLLVHLENLSIREQEAWENAERLRIVQEKREVQKRDEEKRITEEKVKAEQERITKANLEAELKASKEAERLATQKIVGEEFETPFWRRLKFSWEGLVTGTRYFAGISLFIDFVLVAFGFSLVQTPPGKDVPFYLTAIQVIVAVAIGFFNGLVETEPPPSHKQFKDTSKESIWRQVAAHAWGLVGFIFWGFITLLSIFIFALRVVDMESQLTLYIVLGGFLLGIFVGIERWDAWKNGARDFLVDSFNNQ